MTSKQEYLDAILKTKEEYGPIILSEQGWKFNSEKDLVRIYTRPHVGGPDLVKGVALFRNITPSQFMKYIGSDDLSFRQSWDTVVSMNEYVERYSETFEVIHNEYTLPVITKRDFVHAKEVFVAEDGSQDAVSTSVDALAKVPVNNGAVRGQFNVSWWHAESVGEDLRVIFSHQTLLNGWVPTYVINLSVTDSPRMLAKLATRIGTELIKQ
jgi:hypothetical protein